METALSSAKAQQERHDREIAELLAQHQNLLVADSPKAQKQQERDAELARIADLKQNLNTVTAENKKLGNLIAERKKRLEDLWRKQLEQQRKELGDFFFDKKKHNRRR
jgi:hypothetical protein